MEGIDKIFSSQFVVCKFCHGDRGGDVKFLSKFHFQFCINSHHGDDSQSLVMGIPLFVSDS